MRPQPRFFSQPFRKVYRRRTLPRRDSLRRAKKWRAKKARRARRRLARPVRFLARYDPGAPGPSGPPFPRLDEEEGGVESVKKAYQPGEIWKSKCQPLSGR